MKRLVFGAAVILSMAVAPAMAAKAPKLKGTCIWQSVSYETTSGTSSGAGPLTIIAELTFDGHGNLSVTDYDVNTNGTFSSATSIQGAYQIDSNGHGTFSYTSPVSGRALTWDFFLTRKRKSLKVMLESDQNPPPLPRVSSGECRFDE